MKTKIAIFASGQGSNARRLIDYFKGHEEIEVNCIVCNRKEAGVYRVGEELGIDAIYFSKSEIEHAHILFKTLEEREVNWIVLAGFLLKVPEELIKKYPNRIVNIHPSLLPKFGGKGMYGDHVHKAVIESNEEKSGISIHFVDENYDSGSMIKQFDFALSKNETVSSLKLKIQQLEHEHFPKVIEGVILNSLD